MMEKIDPKIIDGKPHFGHWYGTYSFILHDVEINTDSKDLNQYKKMFPHVYAKFCDFEIRNESHIYKKPLMLMGSTVAMKFVVYGRAYKVMRLQKKGIPRYKKVRVNGRFKYKRIDKALLIK